MESFKAVIERFGTVERFAEIIGVNPRTAYSWHQRDSIPHAACARVVAAAQERDFDDITHALLNRLAEKRAAEGPARARRARITQDAAA